MRQLVVAALLVLAACSSTPNASTPEEKAANAAKWKQTMGAIGRGLETGSTRTTPATPPYLNPVDPTPAYNQPAKMVCFFKSEYTSGQNKICNYDCLGSFTPMVQPAYSVCLPSINR